MAEEVGIVMTLYDRVSPTLKSIAGSNKAFDKSLDELEASLKAYDKAQTELVGRSANLKKAIAETDVKVREAQKSYRKLKDETSKGALDDAIDEQARLRRELSDTETAIKENSAAYQDLYKQARNAASAISPFASPPSPVPLFSPPARLSALLMAEAAFRACLYRS